MEKIKENKKIIISLILIIVVIGIIGLTYAWLTTKVEGNKTNVIMAKSLKLEIKNETNAINIEKAEPLPDSEGLEQEEYEFTIENIGNLKSDYTVYLEDVDTGNPKIEDKYLNYTLNSNEEIHKLTETKVGERRVLDTGTIGVGETKVYKLRIWVDKNADNEVMEKEFSSKIKIEGTQAKKKNIKVAYTYNETAGATQCITGEEATCQITECYKDKGKNKCPMGTIVKYAVNDSEEKYFYVLHDDGETLTLQQRENTVRNVAWYEVSDNTKGPLTILPELESATSNWTNVDDQTYTMGTTNFNNTNAFTGCYPYNSCTTNIYTLSERTAKARMITMQEVAATGCRTISNGSCPDYMQNYLYESTSNGGSIDDNSQNASGTYNYGYWTMSAYSSTSVNSVNAWSVRRNGNVNGGDTVSIAFGARAVVVVTK